VAVALTIKNMQGGYIDICEAVRQAGRKVSPRGMETLELPNATIELTDPRKALASGINRKLNTKLVAAEGVQLVGGFSDPAMLVRVAPNMAQFQDGGSFYGAYGPRLKSQLHEVVKQLAYDMSTRQAQMAIWQQPDLYVKTKDKPCTSLLQFMVRDDKLELFTTMRSNDCWWGVPYDIAAFCILQLTVAHWLNLDVGSYHHNAKSLHVYTRDFDAIGELDYPTTPAEPTPFFKNYSWSWAQSAPVQDFVSFQQHHILELAYGRAEPLSDQERWFVERLTPDTSAA
jgi:thymidylate synthase